MITPLSSVDELRRLHEEGADRSSDQTVIRVCSTGCRALGALEVCDALEREIAGRGLESRVAVVRTGCHGLCSGAVAMVVHLPTSRRRRGGDIFYQGVSPDDVREIVETTVLGGRAIRRLCFRRGKRAISRQRDIPFYKHQIRLVLRNCGVVDPRSLADAIEHKA